MPPFFPCLGTAANKSKPLPPGDLHASLHVLGDNKQGAGKRSVTKGCEENQRGQASRVGRVAISGRVIREGLPQNQASEQRPGGSEGSHQAYFWEESVPGKRKSKCEDPEDKLPGLFVEKEGGHVG